MSEDWFDRTYRSDETSPPDLDARILKQARRATRRWVIALMAGAALTIAIALALAIVLMNIELDVPPTERQPPREVEPAAALTLPAEQAGWRHDLWTSHGRVQIDCRSMRDRLCSAGYRCVDREWIPG